MPPLQSIRWPDHWYHDEARIRCIVPNCGFVAPAQHVPDRQQEELLDHCSETRGAEHDMFYIMLTQTVCAINDCPKSRFEGTKSAATRNLFQHEKNAHRSVEMSSICSFVRLAREGRIRRGEKDSASGDKTEPDRNCERVAYYRMLDKIWALPAADIITLFQRNGFHNPSERTPENLRKILTHDPLAKDGEAPPFWWPVKAESFLSQCCPNFFDPADNDWARLYTDLREKYADGRI